MVRKKSKIEHYASEYAMSAGDNALSREQINASITAPEFANEHSYVDAMQKGLDDSLDETNDKLI